MWLAALAAGAMLSSCTSEIEQGGLNGDAALADGTVRFVMSLPSGGKVLYPTRMIQEEEEYAVKRLDVWEYNVKADGTKEFLRVHPGVKFSPTTEATQYEGAIEIRKDEA
ncbi:MAG: hypothetical protein K2O56_09285, partial [Muribaculaceae bacterium]|nr:hypothetical protein [Muribaculaceae bacterium]